MRNGYDFFFDTPYGLVTFPITPGELNMTNGTNNEVVNLINEGDVNILKSPKLKEITFEARFPMRKYPYSREVKDITFYMNIFEKLMENKKPFTFIVARQTSNDKQTWSTNITVSLESYEHKESADEGDDVLITFELKQYKDYVIKTIKIPTVDKPVAQSPTENRGVGNKDTDSKTYIVKPGDCLWNIAKKELNNGARWTEIYELNKTVIEDTAKKRRKGKDSNNGHWIYPDTGLILPKK